MNGTLAQIRRHPIKAIGWEELAEATCNAGEVLPGERAFAVLHERSKVQAGPDGMADSWGKKANFLTGRAGGALMGIQARSHGGNHGDHGGKITLSHPLCADITIDPAQDGAALLDWLAPLWPAEQPAPTALVRAPGPTHSFTDEALPFVSLLSTSSLADLEARVGQPLDRARFRGNLWVSGWEPLYERSLTGKALRIGGAEFTVSQPITRCRAIDTDPPSGQRDIALFDALPGACGDHDFGLFLTVTKPGRIAPGDAIEVL